MLKPYTSYNPYYFVPFAVWVVLGGVLLLTNGDESVFRFVNLRNSPIMDELMSAVTLLGDGKMIALVLLVLLGARNLRNWWYASAAILCNVLPALVTQVIKRQVNAPRPLKFFNEAEWIHILPGWARHMEHSFPSGHTCGAFALFTFLAILLPAKFRPWAVVLFLFGMFTAYSRIYLAVHFLKDVYVGSIIGTVLTVLIIALMNRYQSVFFKK